MATTSDLEGSASQTGSVTANTAIVWLDSPGKGNSLSAVVVERLLIETQLGTHDKLVNTLAFLAQGTSFCTGFDMSALDAESDATLLQRFVRIEHLLDMIWRSPVRTVAVAHGRTWGAGADLFAACELRLAKADTTFRFPGAAFGIVLGTRRLAHRIGREQALRITSEGVELDARQALALGLVSAIVEGEATQALQSCCERQTADRETVIALRNAIDTDSRDAESDSDLAALTRSAARPGLKERILAYRKRV